MLSSADTLNGFCDRLRIKFRQHISKWQSRDECRFTNCYNRGPTGSKTAAPMPYLRANTGQVKAGDVGRVVARKPKDVWAVRLATGTYLLDGKYFRPFDEEE